MRQKNQVELNLGTGATGEARSAAAQEPEARAARTDIESRAAVGPSMEAIVERNNLRKALARVKANKGAAGIDGMTVEDLAPYLKEHWPTIRAQLLDGSLQAAAGTAGGDTEGVGRPTAARHSDGARPLHPAGGDAGAAGRLGPDVLRGELRLSAGALGTSGGGAGAGVHRVRPRRRGGL